MRWGDYSAISIDPGNPNRFWVAVEVPVASSGNLCGSAGLAGCWGTQITELTIVPEPAPFVLTAAGCLAAIARRRRMARRRGY